VHSLNIRQRTCLAELNEYRLNSLLTEIAFFFITLNDNSGSGKGKALVFWEGESTLAPEWVCSLCDIDVETVSARSGREY